MNMTVKSWASSLQKIFVGNWMTLVFDIAILVAVVAAVFFLVRFIRGLEIRRMAERMRARFSMESEKRGMAAEQEMKATGYRKKKSFIEKLDSAFGGAGMLSYETQESSETILIKLIIVTVVAAVLVGLIAGSFFAMVLAILVVIAVFAMYVQYRGNKNYMAIEKEMMRFINTADGFSKENNDISYIIGKTYPLLGEPLYSLCRDFYLESVHSGLDAAFNHFEEKIPHRRFREVVHNLYTASKAQAQYGKVLSEAREMMREYVDGKRDRRNLKREKIADFIAVLCVAVLCIYMMGGISDDFSYVMLNTFAGNLLIIASVVCVAIGAVMGMSTDKT